MDLLARVMTGGLHASTPGPADDFWYQPIGSSVLTQAGQRVDPEGARKISAWFRGRDLLATSLAMLPLHLYQRLPDESGAEIARQHPLHDVLHRKPNPSQDSFAWRRQKVYHLIDYGNAYDWTMKGRYFADRLDPIDPTLVTPELLPSGRKLFHVRDPKTGQTRPYTQDEVFHLMGASDDGIVGKGVLQYARESLGTALATESYAARIFSRGFLNGGILEYPGVLDPDSAKRLALSFKTAMGDWHLPVPLEQGTKWVPNNLTPENAQMLLSRKFSINDIARWLGLPPHMLGDLERSTNNNIEHQGQEFVTYNLGPWLSLFEFSFNDQLIAQPAKFYAKFTRDALVRGDITARWEAHVAAVNAGIKSVDEVRAVEDLNKRGGKADELREPENITGKPKAPEPGQRRKAPDTRAAAIVNATAAKLLDTEINAVRKMAVKHAADGDAFAAAVTEFYAKRVELISVALVLDRRKAEEFCAGQAAQVLAGWVEAVELWRSEHYAAGLAALALEEAAA